MRHPKEEQTLIIIKPDAVQRSLVGQIITRFEQKGLEIIGIKMIHASEAVIEEHYAHIKDKPFFPGIKKFMQSAPVVVIALSGINAVSAVRLIVGPTKAYEASAGTIRGDFSMSMQSNVVHASESTEAAEQEIKRFFAEGELLNYEKVDKRYVYADDLLE
jgi:nucleoside-diphosphate kinase